MFFERLRRATLLAAFSGVEQGGGALHQRIQSGVPLRYIKNAFGLLR
jgi:hypothetical protein